MIVTHNMQQAARVAEMTAFFSLDDVDGDGATGTLIEFDATSRIFTNPADSRTNDYVTGRFGDAPTFRPTNVRPERPRTRRARSQGA